ncbi:MAG: M23 family metallopeptidase, partial [Deltaproteobacteria bacterium]
FGYRISPFTGLRQMHEGLDIANAVGTPVFAPADGIVSKVDRENGLGKTISINHGYGIVTRYGHFSDIYVHVGKRVKRGEKVAAVGNTGRSTGPHLHYEVLVNGINVNPEKYILN